MVAVAAGGAGAAGGGAGLVADGALDAGAAAVLFLLGARGEGNGSCQRREGGFVIAGEPVALRAQAEAPAVVRQARVHSMRGAPPVQQRRRAARRAGGAPWQPPEGTF